MIPKFRAWHKKKMYYSDSQKDAELLGAKLGESIMARFMKRFYLHPDCILMQSTGLKDSQSKEIYEGDIVRKESWRVKRDSPPGTNCDFRKRFDKDGPWEKFYSYKVVEEREFFTDSEYGENPKEFEVIGNVFQNKELLNDSKNPKTD